MAIAMNITGRAMRPALVAALLAWPALVLAHGVSPLAGAGEGASNASVPYTLADQPRAADFLGETPSNDARRIADWVVTSGDNAGLPFVIIDKIRAKVLVFDTAGRLRGATLALLGMAHGDDTVPGIGSRKLSSIRPEERTTPAGRFVAALGHDFQQDILWIDYKNAISLHRVIHGAPGDHRLERLATTSPLDKRISFGCINVPVKFYEDIVVRTFTGTTGIVYILPETRPIQEVFPLTAGSGGAGDKSGNPAR
jgi:hypothetical protein